MARKKTWREKLDGVPGLPKVEPIPDRMKPRWGDGEVTPYWRTLKAGGQLNPKYPGGVEAQRAKLASEGHRVVQKGKRWLVSDWRARRFQPL